MFSLALLYMTGGHSMRKQSNNKVTVSIIFTFVQCMFFSEVSYPPYIYVTFDFFALVGEASMLNDNRISGQLYSY